MRCQFVAGLFPFHVDPDPDADAYAFNHIPFHVDPDPDAYAIFYAFNPIFDANANTDAFVKYARHYPKLQVQLL